MMISQNKPNFLYVGAVKSGSSWLYEALRDHPDVFIPLAKDLQFFDQHYYHGVDWYMKHFDGAAGHTAIGELSHDYYLSPDTMQRIAETLPGVRILCCLREPGSLAVSFYNYLRIHRRDVDTLSLDAFVDTEEARTHLDFLSNLQHVYAVLPPESIYVTFFDLLKSDVHRYIHDIYDFLGVDPAYEPAVLQTRVLPAREPRFKAVSQLAYSTAKMLRRLGLTTLVGTVKRNPLFDRLLYDTLQEKQPVSEAALAQVRERAVRDYPQIEALIGKPLPSAWYERAGQPAPR